MNVVLSVVKNSVKVEKVSDYEYFNGEEYSEMVDNSSLGLINYSQGGSVERYLKGFDNTKKSYLEVGSAVHAMMLENCYVLSEYEIPSSRRLLEVIDYMFDSCSFDVNDKISVMEALKTSAIDVGYNNGHVTDKTILSMYEKSIGYIGERWKDYQSGYKDFMIYLPKNSLDTVKACCKALIDNKRIYQLMYPEEDDLVSYQSLNEYAITVDVKVSVDDKEIILRLKGKLDNLVMNDYSYTINDLKTSFHSAKDFNESYKRYHYYRQAAFYRFLCACAFPEKKFSGFNFMCVSTYDFTTCIRRATENEMQYGKEEFTRLLVLIATVKMAKRDSNDINIFERNAMRAIACTYNEKIELLTLLCVLRQAFDKKGENITTRKLLERVRKDKFDSTSESVVQSLSVLMDSFYSPKDTYSTYGLKSGREISDRINYILDKELPFVGSEWDDDLPF